MTTPPASSDPRVKKSGKSPAKAKGPARKPGFFSFDPVSVDVLEDRVEFARVQRVHRMVVRQSIAVLTLALILIATMSYPHTIYHYYALTSDRRIRALTPLIMPNMTNQAVRSWATNSITEIMTFGFGDYQAHLRDQKIRFTPRGWASFVSAFDRMKTGEAFRQRQLVLTTVPSNTAVILSQGENKEHVYEWRVQLPVIMTFATNDNLTRRENASITLTIVRVPASENPGGIAIQSWS